MDIKEISALFLKNRYQLMAYIYALVRDPHVSEDILQEVWVRLSDAVEKKKEIRKFEEWCRGTAKNLVLHHWRKNRNAKVVADTEMLDLIQKGFEENDLSQGIYQQKRESLFKCLDALPSESKNLLNMKYERGMSCKNMAQHFDKSVSAIMMSLSRIRKSLQSCIEQRLQIQAKA